jgi:TRAP-type uncharacterized transport system substrate-binding protein
VGAVRLPAKGSKRKPAPKIKSIDELAGIASASSADASQCHTAARDPHESGVNADKVTVTQFATNQIAEMAATLTLDAYMTVGPLDSKITKDAIARRREPGRTEIPADRVSETIAKKHPLYESEEIPAASSVRRRRVRRTRSTRSASII